MTFTKREITRAKAIFARKQQAEYSATMTYAVAAPLSRPWRRTALVHRRTWRDCLVQARKELLEEDGRLD